jgi:hypothetical protein
MVNWGEKSKKRLVIQAENETEARLLAEFASLARREGRTAKWLIMGWVAAFVAAKEANHD